MSIAKRLNIEINAIANTAQARREIRLLATEAAKAQKLANADLTATLSKSGTFDIRTLNRVNQPLERINESLAKGKFRAGEFGVAMRNVNAIAAKQIQFANSAFIPTYDKMTGAITGGTLAMHKYSAAQVTAGQRMMMMNTIMRTQATNMIDWGKNMQWAGRQITVGLGVPLSIFAVGAGKAFMDLEDQIVRFRKVFNEDLGDLGENQTKMLETSRELVSSYGIMQNEVVGVGATLAQAGFHGDKLTDSMKEIVRISQLGDIDLDVATQFVRSLQANQEVLNEGSLSTTLNLINAIENSTGINTRELAEELPLLMAQAKQFGLTATDVSAVLAGMRETLGNTSEAATALRFSFNRVLNPTEEARRSFREVLNIDYDQFIARFDGDIIGLYSELGRVIGDVKDQVTDAELQTVVGELFGVRQVSRIQTALDAMRDYDSTMTDISLATNDYQRARIAANDADKAAASAAREVAAQQESVSGRFRRALADVQAELAEFGKPFIEAGTMVLRVLQGIMQWFQGLPSSVKKFVGIVAVAGAVTGVLTMTVGVLANLFGNLVSGFLKLFPAMKVFTEQQTIENRMLEQGNRQLDILNDQLLESRLMYQNLSTAIHGATGAQQAFNLSAGADAMFFDAGGRLQKKGGGFAPTSSRLPSYHPARTVDPADHPNAKRLQGDTSRGRGRLVGGLMAGGMTASMLAGGGGGGMGGLGAAMTVAFIGPMLVDSVRAMKDFGSATLASMKSLRSGAGAISAMKGGVSSLVALAGGPLGIAVAGVAAGLFMWHKHTQRVNEETKGISSHVNALKDSFGLAGEAQDRLKAATGDAAEEATMLTKEQIDANRDLIDEVQALGAEAGKERLMHIGYQLVQQGNDPEQVMQMLKGIAHEAFPNLELNIKVNFLTDREEYRQSFNTIVSDIASIIPSAWQKGWADVLGEGLTQQQERQVIESLALPVAEAFESGQYQFGIENIFNTVSALAAEMARVQGERSRLGAKVRAGTASDSEISRLSDLQTQYQNLNKVQKQFFRQIVIQGQELGVFSDTINDKAVTSIEDFIDVLDTPGNLGVLARVKSEFEDLAAIEASRGGLLEGDGDGFLSASTKAELLTKAIDNLIMKASSPEEKEALEGLKGDIDAIGESSEKASINVGSLVNSLRSEITSAANDVGDAVAGAVDEQRDAVKALYDAERDKLREVARQADELDNKKKKHYENQLRRLQDITNQIQGQIDLEFAIAGGDLQAAAQIREKMRGEKARRALEAMKQIDDERKKARDEELEQQIEALNAKEEAELEALDASEEAFDDWLEKRLRKLPSSEAEWMQLMKDIQNKAKELGINIDSITAEFGVKGFQEAVKAWADQIEEDDRWEKIGEKIAEKVGKGMEATDFAGMIENALLGGMSLEDAFGAIGGLLFNDTGGGTITNATGAQTAGLDDLAQNWNDAVRLSEKLNEKMNFNRGGRVPGQGFTDTVPAMLTPGEFVLRRDAVKALGIDTLMELNGAKPGSFNSGGMVQKFARGGLVGALAPSFLFAGMFGALFKKLLAMLSGGAFLKGTQAGNMNAMTPEMGSGAFQRGGGKEWPAYKRGRISPNTKSALGFLKENWELPHGVAASTDRKDPASDHGKGKALDVMVAPLGKFAQGDQINKGWQIANWFQQNPGAFGTKYIIWQKMINSGTGWKPYTRYGENPGATLGHYDHIHLSFMNKGGPVQLAKGGRLKHDNVLANLHKGETVLRAPVAANLEAGIAGMANGMGGYEVNLNIGNFHGTEENIELLARKVEGILDRKVARRGQNRTVR